MKRTAAILMTMLCATAAFASVPDWLRRAAQTPLPVVDGDVHAVVLLDEQVTTVKDNGEVYTVYRRALKILRPQGRDDATATVAFDKETKLTWLKAWSISPEGHEVELKEKDAVETALFSEALYDDTRHKILHPPADVGSVFGYEFEQKRRPLIYEDSWHFQEHLPVAVARFELHMPPGWEYAAHWVNHAALEPQPAGAGTWRWELKDISGLQPERDMPAFRAIAGRLALSYFPANNGLKLQAEGSWKRIGDWYANLIQGRAAPTPEIQARAAELTAAAKSPIEKMRLLGTYVQRNIRYVAVEIGVGGFQPHFAGDILKNQYGDCKDKVTLLSALLRASGIESRYVLIHSDRGVVRPEIPAAMGFNHAILAIELPADADTKGVGAVVHPAKRPALLLFDPTSELTSFGHVPTELQGGYGLIVASNQSELMQVPVADPATNRLVRNGHLQLTADGGLRGSVDELRSGELADSIRQRMLTAKSSDRAKVIESLLSPFLNQFRLTAAKVGNLELYDQDLTLHYEFEAANYAKVAGPLIMVRPRVLGEKSDDVLESSKPRQFAVQFNQVSDEVDTFEIQLPEGYSVDELPAETKALYGFADYTSHTETAGNAIRYTREYKVSSLSVDATKFDALKKLYRQIAGDERSAAVLKHATTKAGQ